MSLCCLVGEQMCGGDLSAHLICGLSRRSFRSLLFVSLSLSVALVCNAALATPYYERSSSDARAGAGAGAAARNADSALAALIGDNRGAGAAAGAVSYAQHPLSSGGFLMPLTSSHLRELAPALCVCVSGFCMVLWCVQSGLSAETSEELRAERLHRLIPGIVGVMYGCGMGLVGLTSQAKTLGALNALPCAVGWAMGDAVSWSRFDGSVLAVLVFAVLPNVLFSRITRQRLQGPFFASAFEPVQSQLDLQVSRCELCTQTCTTSHQMLRCVLSV